MKKIMFYSYKGGSGRTVASGNVAAALAKLGQRTAVIDLDFEAPGLHHVLGAEGTQQYEAGLGIQHYLRGDIDLEKLEKEVVINMFEGPLHRIKIPDGSCLLYIMASPKVTQVNSHDPNVEVRMKNLLDSLEKVHNIDIVIIDAASGIRDAYSIAADVSTEMLIFFRWSKQHVEGTLRMVGYLKLLKQKYGKDMPFKLVASASPGERELNEIPDDALREALLGIRTTTKTRIEQTLTDCEVVPPEIFGELPEMVELKWRETLTVFGANESPYETLAQRLI